MREPYIEFNQDLSKEAKYTWKCRGTHQNYERDIRVFWTTGLKSNLSYVGNTKWGGIYTL